MSGLACSLADIEAAAGRINGVAVETPLIESAALNARLGLRVLIKPETLQRVGAFKFRGAYNRLVQLTAERAGFHPVARACFSPPPNVDSALVALRRTRWWGGEYGKVKQVVQGAFAHRRKTLVNSLELAGVAPRAASLEALEALELRVDVRAEALEPAAFVELAEALP